MNQHKLEEILLSLFRQKEIMKSITAEQDFFELGVSSLTIVEMQIAVEKELQVEVSTSTLMGAPTVSEWVEVYSQKINSQESAES